MPKLKHLDLKQIGPEERALSLPIALRDELSKGSYVGPEEEEGPFLGADLFQV